MYTFHNLPFGIFFPLVIAVLIISIILDGYALWNAARSRQKYWFIALLVVHTLGILPAIYLIFFKKDPAESRVAPPPAEPPITLVPEPTVATTETVE
jgi:hypothetical protein